MQKYLLIIVYMFINTIIKGLNFMISSTTTNNQYYFPGYLFDEGILYSTDNHGFVYDGINQDSKNEEMYNEKVLWQSVILQAIYDVMMPPTTQEDRREKNRAIAWFNKANKDFLLVCDMAGMSPDFTIMGMKKALQRSNKKHRRKISIKRLLNIKKARNESLKSTEYENWKTRKLER